MSGQLNQRVKKGRIQGKDQEKGHIRGQSVRGSVTERSASRCGKARRYQGYWMGISMMRFQEWSENNGYEGDSFEMGAAVLFCTAFIGLSVPSHLGSASVHVLCTPIPSKTSHTHLHSDSANRLIFREQWCQLFIPPLPSLFHLSNCDWLSLYPLSLILCLCLSLPLVMRWHWLRLLLMPPCSCPRKCPRLVCVFVWGIAARALACWALSARSFRFVSRVEVWLNGNWWVCMGQY